MRAKDNGITSVATEGESTTSSISQPAEVDDESSPDTFPDHEFEAYLLAESNLRRKVDLRLCTIAGLLCSLNLLDSGIISSASVTSMLSDLDLAGNRYSVAIFIFTVSSIIFQLPSTILVRQAGPRIYFSLVTISFGIITICTAFITTWKQMIALRVLLGMTMSGIYPGLSYLISTWYTRKEQQLRFAFLQTGEVIILATGSIVNWGLNHLDHRHGLRGWQWMFLVQGTITTFLGLITYFWMVDFPESSQNSFKFLSPTETALAVSRINTDRSDGSKPTPISPAAILNPFFDPKLYIFSTLFFLLNIVSTALSYASTPFLSDQVSASTGVLHCQVTVYRVFQVENNRETAGQHS
jgi:MFS family permease